LGHSCIIANVFCVVERRKKRRGEMEIEIETKKSQTKRKAEASVRASKRARAEIAPEWRVVDETLHFNIPVGRDFPTVNSYRYRLLLETPQQQQVNVHLRTDRFTPESNMIEYVVASSTNRNGPFTVLSSGSTDQLQANQLRSTTCRQLALASRSASVSEALELWRECLIPVLRQDARLLGRYVLCSQMKNAELCEY
jgi:hypothetical protein